MSLISRSQGYGGNVPEYDYKNYLFYLAVIKKNLIYTYVQKPDLISLLV